MGILVGMDVSQFHQGVSKFKLKRTIIHVRSDDMFNNFLASKLS